MTYEQHYAQCIANGCSPGCADMLAAQSPPACKTDTRRAANHKYIRDQLKDHAPMVVKATQKRNGGWTPPDHYVYDANLAQYDGDKAAWCPPHDIQGHKRRVCAKRNLGLVNDDGKVIVKRVHPDRDPMDSRIKLSKSLVNREYLKLAKEHPEILKYPKEQKRELRRQIVDKHGQK